MNFSKVKAAHSDGFYNCIEHIKDLRIEKAKNLLKSTDKSITEIAALCGIPDYNYFTKVFKSETNETPSKYRKSNK